MNKKVGRKPLMTKSVLQKLKEAYLMGCTDREACLLAGISESTLYDYQSKNKEFLEQKQRFKTNPTIKARQTVIASLNDPKVAMWYLERKCKNEFGPKGHFSEDQVERGLTEEEREEMKKLLDMMGITYTE